MPTLSLPANVPVQGAAAKLASQLRAGRMYRREDLSRMSNAVDRHLRELIADGRLKKMAQGLYYAPRRSSLGLLPPEDAQLVGSFLRDKSFLVFSPSAYNVVGLGTTQLYNRTLVYNHKRHGVFKFGNRQFDFRIKPHFPRKLTTEFLFVDLLNNLDSLAEDRDAVLRQARDKLLSIGGARLARAADAYGNLATKKRIKAWVNG